MNQPIRCNSPESALIVKRLSLFAQGSRDEREERERWDGQYWGTSSRTFPSNQPESGISDCSRGAYEQCGLEMRDLDACLAGGVAEMFVECRKPNSLSLSQFKIGSVIGRKRMLLG